MSEDLLHGQFYAVEMHTLALRINEHHGIDPKNLARRSRILHEYDHLMRLLGTPYGLIRHGLMSNFAWHFFAALKTSGDIETLQKNWQIVLQENSPVLTVNQFSSLFFGDNNWSDIFRAQCALSAVRFIDNADIKQLRTDALLGMTQYLYTLTGKNFDSPSTFINDNHNLWRHFPQNMRTLYLGGKSIPVHSLLEYLGVVVELAHTAEVHGSDTEFPKDLRPADYVNILHLIKKILPEAVNPDSQTIAQEVEALVELSLWIPLWPDMDFDQLPLHGGYFSPVQRFAMILQSCKSLGLSMQHDKAFDITTAATRGKDIQQAICDHLGWPTPAFIAQKWHRALVAIEQQADHLVFPFYFQHPTHPRLKWSIELLSEFAHNPVSGPILAASHYFERINFPTIFDLNQKDAGYKPHENAKVAQQHRNNLPLDALMLGVTKAAVNPNEWLRVPEPVKQQALATWQLYLAQLPI